ncbi:MAG: hypothetical protein GY786_00240, partial [Proteobacteria bacterium]|nr:hypothetical protein [Pseudomonadota bacterium]
LGVDGDLSLFKMIGKTHQKIATLSNGSFGYGDCDPPGQWMGGKLYFTASIGANSLWCTDGTPEGTKKIYESGYLFEFICYKNRVYFSANGTASTGGVELLVYDPVDDTVKLFVDLSPGKSSGPSGYLVFNDTLYFTAETPEYGREIWRTAGTKESTELFMDINKGSKNGAFMAEFFPLGNEFLFPADDGVHGIELWKSDGTPSGTKMLNDINAGEGSSKPGPYVKVKDVVYFSAYDPKHGTELWKTNGIQTEFVADVQPGVVSSEPYDIVSHKDYVYFTAQLKSIGRQLFRVQYEPFASSASMEQIKTT